MENSTDAITFDLEAIDHERDIVPTIVVVPDYNGDPIIHVFITGERVLRMSPGEDWDFQFPYPDGTAERQAVAALHYHLGSMTEDQDQRLAAAWGHGNEIDVFDHVMSMPTDEGHALVAWAGEVAFAVDERLANDDRYAHLNRPTGW